MARSLMTSAGGRHGEQAGQRHRALSSPIPGQAEVQVLYHAQTRTRTSLLGTCRMDTALGPGQTRLSPEMVQKWEVRVRQSARPLARYGPVSLGPLPGLSSSQKPV